VEHINQENVCHETSASTFIVLGYYAGPCSVLLSVCWTGSNLNFHAKPEYLMLQRDMIGI
jgi:uncharacterized membrane protein YphA (DoxX/SURF4 family)